MNDKLVEVKNLCKSFNKKLVLDHISFDVGKNEIVGFIGPNGAGKSTTMKCLCGLIHHDEGDILMNGFDVKKQRKMAMKSMASMIEYPGLFSELTGRENIKMVSQLKRIPSHRIEEVIHFVDIGEAIDKKVSRYSLGMKQRLGLGIAILSKPKFLILDEPTNGLDPTGVINLRNTLKDLIKHEDMSILFSSHQLGEIERLADRIICINNGKIVDVPVMQSMQLNYMIQFKDPLIDAVQSFLVLNGTQLERISSNVIKISIESDKRLNELLKYFVLKNVEIVDIYRETVDIEMLYKSVYNVESEV